LISLVISGAMLIGNQVILRLRQPHGTVWDGYSTILLIAVGVSFLAGMIAICLDYHAAQRKNDELIAAMRAELMAPINAWMTQRPSK
jgi:ABC-type Fe3+ transport system permease subunit